MELYKIEHLDLPEIDNDELLKNPQFMTLPNEDFPIQVTEQQHYPEDILEIFQSLKKKDVSFIVAKKPGRKHLDYTIFRKIDRTDKARYKRIVRRSLVERKRKRYQVVYEYEQESV